MTTPIFVPSTAGRSQGSVGQSLLAQAKQFPAGSRVVVGFSGGTDSLALALLLARVAPVSGIQAHLLHVDHRLRKSSSAEALEARHLSEAIGLPFEIISIPPGAIESHRGVGVEEAARRERYVALALAQEGLDAVCVALAHTLGDQAETVLLHLLRGAGVSGAGAMATVSSVQVPWWNRSNPIPMTIWRPLLDVSRSDIEPVVSAFGADSGLRAVQDPSNTSPAFTRNRLRTSVLPGLEKIVPGAAAALGRYAKIAAEEDRWLEKESNRRRCELESPHGLLDCDGLASLPIALSRRVVRAWVADADPTLELSLERVDAIVRGARTHNRSRRLQIGEGWTIRQERGEDKLRMGLTRSGGEGKTE